MRIKVTKPFRGKVDIHLDDHLGQTRQNVRRQGVSLDEAEGVVAGLLAEWERARGAIKEARKRKGP